MGSAPVTIEMQPTATAPPPVIAHSHSTRVWTVSRISPIVGIFAAAVAEVALKPNVSGSLIVVAVEIVFMGVLVKTWLSH
jgi:hypothetical protein